MLMFHIEKGVTFFGLLRFLSSHSFACVATDHSVQRVEQLELRTPRTLAASSGGLSTRPGVG